MEERFTCNRQRLRAVLSELGNVAIEPLPQKTFDAKGAILERTLTKCLNDRAIALKNLADSARLVDKAAFGHQVYLRDKLNLDQAANCVAHV